MTLDDQIVVTYAGRALTTGVAATRFGLLPACVGGVLRELAARGRVRSLAYDQWFVPKASPLGSETP